MTRVANRWAVLGLASFLVILLCDSSPARAQDSGFNLAIHARSHTTAADIGVPTYPGATLYKDSSDAGVDLGFSYGDTHFRLLVASYASNDTQDKILAFYRNALSRYGDVLECVRGKPLGDLTATRSGLTCSGKHGSHVHLNGHDDSSTDHELRAGSPHQMRIVGIDERNPTHFALVYLDVPKDSGDDDKSE
jgi:hypothetical protein